MTYDHNTTDCVANGGGEASATGNTLGYTNPTGRVVRVTKIHIMSGIGAASTVLLTDSVTIATAMPAVARKLINVPDATDVVLTEKELGKNFLIVAGIVYQSSIGATGNGIKMDIETEVPGGNAV